MGKRTKIRPPIPPPSNGDAVSSACAELLGFMREIGAAQVSLLVKGGSGQVIAAFYCVTEADRAKKLAAAMDARDA